MAGNRLITRLILFTLLLGGCAPTLPGGAQPVSPNTANLPAYRSDNQSVTKQDTVVIYVYPKTGAISAGRYYRLPLPPQPDE